MRAHHDGTPRRLAARQVEEAEVLVGIDAAEGVLL